MEVCPPAILTVTVSHPEAMLTSTYNLSATEATSAFTCFDRARLIISGTLSGDSSEITFKPAAAFPARAPATAATSTPDSPVPGTITAKAFFITLADTRMSIRSTLEFPKYLRHTAAAYATATGSVQPVAGLTPSSKTCKKLFLISSVSILLSFLFDFFILNYSSSP